MSQQTERAQDTVSDEVAPSGDETPRRAYEAPRLRHLGSVRSLTLASTGAVNDGGPGKFSRRS